MAEKKSKGQERYDELAYEKKNYFEVASEEERAQMFAYAEGYKAFLDEAKTCLLYTSPSPRDTR